MNLSDIFNYIPYLKVNVTTDLYTRLKNSKTSWNNNDLGLHPFFILSLITNDVLPIVFDLFNSVFIIVVYFRGIRYVLLSIKTRVKDYFNSRTPEEKQSDLNYNEFLEKQKEDRRIRKFMDTLNLRNRL